MCFILFFHLLSKAYSKLTLFSTVLFLYQASFSFHNRPCHSPSNSACVHRHLSVAAASYENLTFLLHEFLRRCQLGSRVLGLVRLQTPEIGYPTELRSSCVRFGGTGEFCWCRGSTLFPLKLYLFLTESVGRDRPVS